MSEFVLPSLDANILRFTDLFSIILGSLESSCSGLYRQKKRFMFKVEKSLI
ncbi:hypothetical protein RhiirA1_472680 [Rhizophagus irregularis]|uniref:Uncharacterized protein n=1 Tax=Rhizophagus irregularis TaxID=588596 RepID=A0A2N0R1Z1_9GLOM|nr:hypothetical protein RhiirA1_472680 [Rhizophagus irregularis]